MKNTIFAFFFLSAIVAHSQEQINSSMPFQTDPSKDFSLYIPSVYEDGESIAAFVALHPWNTSRWNAETWCEELADFAEANDVILICPDGGEDGQIDDAIDTAFTSFLLDSALLWYDINPEQVYAIGFSWGGKTVYTYGLQHREKFAGLLPIGAAVTIGEVDDFTMAAEDLPVYIVHGSQDSPNTRYFPLLSAMEDNGACVESNLLQGVGHTIDFDNQVEILTDAYSYLKENPCVTVSAEEVDLEQKKVLKSSLLARGELLNIDNGLAKEFIIRDFMGNIISQGNGSFVLVDFPAGTYLFSMENRTEKFQIY